MSKSISFTAQLAELVAGMRFSDLPPKIVENAKTRILDSIGVLLAGCTTKFGQQVISYANSSSNESSIICRKRKANCAEAAFVNSNVMDIPELEDGHRRIGLFHPSITIIPAALALAEKENVEGKDLIMSIVVGYEVCIRVGQALKVVQNYPTPISPTITCGIMGATAAGCRLLNLSPTLIRKAWGLAACLMPASYTPRNRRIHLKLLLAGATSENAVKSVLLSELGYSPSYDIFEDEKGFLQSQTEDYDPKALIEEFGKTFYITSGYFKPYASCRYTHPAVTAALRIHSEYEPQNEDIEEIIVKVGRVTADLRSGRDLNLKRVDTFESETIAKFSIPYTVAAAIARGKVGLEEFNIQSLSDDIINELMQKVTVVPLAEFDLLPEKLPAQVEVRTKSGTVYNSYTDYPLGEPELPLSKDEIMRKFIANSTGAIETSQAKEVAEIIEQLDDLNSVREMTSLLNTSIGEKWIVP